jgi:hypothetical protein
MYTLHTPKMEDCISMKIHKLELGLYLGMKIYN